MSQATLFGAAEPPGTEPFVQPAEPTAELLALAQALDGRWGSRLHLGTSSWHFPGWAGLVWHRACAQPELSRYGLAAYARHPLLRTVSLDRAFHQPLDATTYRRYTAQVDEAFRFVVKAPAAVSDAVLRTGSRDAALQGNPRFLDPRAALELCVKPALEGLGAKLGVLVFQISPLSQRWLVPGALIGRLETLWQAVVPALPTHTRVALELRDAELLTPTLCASLKAHGVRLCLGLHDRMPAIDAQLPAQRALWPGDLVCRWNLQRGLRYTQAKELWEPFNRLQAPDPATRSTLARVLRATLDAGHHAFVTINNKAEGSAPLSVLELARALRA